MSSRQKVPTLDLPDFYDPDQAYNQNYCANPAMIQQLANKWRQRYKLKPVGADEKRVTILDIDNQGDFDFSSGALFVAGRSGMGANDALRLSSEFIYRYLPIISSIIPSLDTHEVFQIFFASAHLRRDGTHPPAHTIISAEEYRRGDYRPNPAMAVQLGCDPSWLQKQFVYYCEQLEKAGKYQLYLWPYHCLLGHPGHRRAGVIEAARLLHCFARGAANAPEMKGDVKLTEHYSIFSPEVSTTWDGLAIPGAQRNVRLIEKVMSHDVVIAIGEASSHCYQATIQDLLEWIRQNDPSLAKKVYLMRDCTAAVVVPNVIDYTDKAEAAFQKFQAAGMHVVESTTPIEEWPEMPCLA